MNLLMATGLSVIAVTLCILLHYEALNLLERTSRLLRRHRWIVLLTMYGLILAHIVEIWLFGMAYYVAQHWLQLGEINTQTGDWFDYVYYSAIVYTTVGFGDVVPNEGLRMLTATEALAVFSLITWSASFTFLQMQRLWRP